MGVEQGGPIDKGLLGTDINWQTAHGQDNNAEEEPSEVLNYEAKLEVVKATPEYLALDSAAQEDVVHVLEQLLDSKVTHGVKTLTPEADEVVAKALGLRHGHLGGKDTSFGMTYYSTTAYPDIARTVTTNNAGQVIKGYTVLHENQKYWD